MKTQIVVSIAALLSVIHAPFAFCGPKAPEVPECPQPNIQPPLKSQNTAIPNEILELRLRGALCPACLKHLQAKIQNLPGIKEAHVEAGSQPQQQANGSIKPQRIALVFIKFDARLITVKEITDLIKANDFGITRLVLKVDVPAKDAKP